MGQLNEKLPSNVNIVNILEDRYQKYCKQNYIAKVDKLNYLRIQFNDKPYLIEMGQNGQSPIPAIEPDTGSTVLGHLIEINGKVIVVKDPSVYELKHSDVNITSISFPVETDAVLDYELTLSQNADEGKVIKSFSYKKVIGQLRGFFEESDELIAKLREKYNMNYSEWYQELTVVNGIRVEADEGTIVYVKEEGEAEYQKHIIGPTESLDFYDPDSVINGMYFYGKHFSIANEWDLERNTLPLNKIVDSEISAETIEEIQNPLRNNFYLINGQRKLYYRDAWYDIDENNNIQYPVYAMVDYYCECAKGYYANPS